MTAKSAKAKVKTTSAAPKARPAGPGATLLVGLDLGTNTSCLMSAVRGSERSPTRELIPTVVGYAKEDVLNGILPGDATVLFGRLAQKHRRSLNLVRPLKGGVIADADSARQFAVHLRDLLQPEGREVRAVVGLPASSDSQARESVRTAFRGVFHKIIFVPEPFLAAIGYRDDARISDVNYRDPVLNSLYIDIGAGSTDVCLVQGHYPQPEDQLSVPFAGDAVDQIIHELVLAEYPESGLTLTQATEFKERYSWVLAKASAPAVVTVMVGGKPRQIDITAQVGIGCDTLLQKVFELSRDLISRAAPETVTELLQNVIVTGGGSLIKGFGEALQAKLKKEGFENPTVQVLGQNFKDYVALGALKLARRARDNQWQTLIG